MNWYKKAQDNLNEYDPTTINKHMDEFMSTQQQNSTDSDNFAIDLRSKPIAIKPAIRKAMNSKIHDLGNYHVEIPLQQIFDILAEFNTIALQEDGKPWSGMLIGGAECGSDKARDQYANFQLAHKPSDDVYMYNPFGDDSFKMPNGGYKLAKQGLLLTWCKMSSGKYEIVSYVN